MPEPSPETLKFQARRQSVPARAITGPVPGDAELLALLTPALRVPDHGKLEPWRLIVLRRAALDRLAEALRVRQTELGKDGETADKAAQLFAAAPLMVAVVACPADHIKIPRQEQLFSAAALSYSVLTAMLAAGWAATWQTGPAATDEAFLAANLGTGPGEFVAGFVVVGSSGPLPPDRPRPDPARKIAWVSA